MANDVIWAIAALSAFGVIVRPWKLPEAIWAVSGAALLTAFGLLPWRDALAAIGKGTDVYLFLTGMMILAELARKEGLFDFLAGGAARMAQGSATKLFALVYGVGTMVTVLMSNDATAVVLTPAVFAATKAAKVKDPLPYLFICAFIANAASFVLPISIRPIWSSSKRTCLVCRNGSGDSRCPRSSRSWPPSWDCGLRNASR